MRDDTSQPHEREPSVTTPTPWRGMDVHAEAASPDAFARFTATLTELGVPARVTDEQNADGTGFVHGVLLVSKNDRPLRARTAGGALEWSELSTTTVKIALATALGGDVTLDGIDYRLGGDSEQLDAADDVTHELTDAHERERGSGGAEENSGCAASGIVQNFVWYAPDNAEFGGIWARNAGEALHLQRRGSAGIFSPTESAERVFESGVWAVSGNVALWQQSRARLAAIGTKNRVLMHVWDQNWRVLDPAPYVRDEDGKRVADYLDEFEDLNGDAAEWTDALRLTPEKAEALRILFRTDASDETTFARLAQIVGVPGEMADIADGRTRIEELPGAAVALPSSSWSALKSAVREEFSSGERSEKAPPRGWAGHRDRRSALYLTLMGLVVAGLAAVLVHKLVTGDTGTAWIQVVLIAALAVELALPRRRA